MKNSVGWHWRGRDGGEHSLTLDVGDLTETTVDQARDEAKKLGYPGHRGGWWNYLVDDVAKLLGTRR